jgi:hypothetical protein
VITSASYFLAFNQARSITCELYVETAEALWEKSEELVTESSS